MSKGMGKVQKAILQCLELREGKWTSLLTLTIFAYHSERYAHDGSYYLEDGPDSYAHTISEYVATQRAMSRLEELGLIETRQMIEKWPVDHVTKYTEARLSVDIIP